LKIELSQPGRSQDKLAWDEVETSLSDQSLDESIRAKVEMSHLILKIELTQLETQGSG